MTGRGGTRRQEAETREAAPSTARAWPDAATVVTVYLAVLLAVPAARRIEALGGAGSPGALVATLGLVWWGWHRVQSRRSGARPFQPVAAALVLFSVGILFSYAVSSMMALPAAERSVADMGILRVVAVAGILLVAHDGISRRDRFLLLMRRMSMFGGLYATLGLIQFFTGQNVVDSWDIPGLSEGGWTAFGERAGFVRAISTAMHPLEAAIVLAMILPISLTIALYDRQRSGFVRWYPVIAITFLSVLSVTRSALLGVAVVFAVLFGTWPKAVRQWMGLAIIVGSITVFVGVPGMVGTIIGMFSGTDASLASRTESYDTVAAFVQISPLFGRGFGMFLPSYRILDNQFLLTLVETGAVGLLGLIALIVAACWAATSRRRVWGAGDELMGAFGYALLASILAGSLLLAFFDAFSFPQACGMFFLIIGLCGAYLNICRAQGKPKHCAVPQTVRSRRSLIGRRALALAALVAMAGMSASILTSRPLYYSRVDVLFLLPDATDDANSLLGDPGLTLYLAGIVERTFNDEYGGTGAQTTGAPLYGTGVRYGHWVHIPATGGQWQTSYDRPLVAVEIVGESPDEVSSQIDLYTGRVTDLASSSQEQLNIPAPLHISTSQWPALPRVELIGTKKSRAAAALGLITLIAVSAITPRTEPLTRA